MNPWAQMARRTWKDKYSLFQQNHQNSLVFIGWKHTMHPLWHQTKQIIHYQIFLWIVNDSHAKSYLQVFFWRLRKLTQARVIIRNWSTSCYALYGFYARGILQKKKKEIQYAATKKQHGILNGWGQNPGFQAGNGPAKIKFIFHYWNWTKRLLKYHMDTLEEKSWEWKWKNPHNKK